MNLLLLALIGILILALAGSIRRQRRRARMTPAQRRAQEILPWYRERIR